MLEYYGCVSEGRWSKLRLVQTIWEGVNFCSLESHLVVMEWVFYLSVSMWARECVSDLYCSLGHTVALVLSNKLEDYIVGRLEWSSTKSNDAVRIWRATKGLNLRDIVSKSRIIRSYWCTIVKWHPNNSCIHRHTMAMFPSYPRIFFMALTSHIH